MFWSSSCSRPALLVALALAVALALQACTAETGNRGARKVNPEWADQKDGPHAGEVPGAGSGYTPSDEEPSDSTGSDQDELPLPAPKDAGPTEASDG